MSEHELVRYDRAILFDYGKGQLLLSAGNTLPGRFEIQYKPDVIAEILETLSIRKAITNERELADALAEKTKIESGRIE
ncbi:MAG TPA: hypothetical protein PKD26_06220 [Pyrinomonadaceae bacterium]|nr:hypothetical protein [Pyrinomonadaceae bacterium]